MDCAPDERGNEPEAPVALPLAGAEARAPAARRVEPPPDDDLDDRETRILLELARDAEARVAFTGLKRRLGVHQQVLARTLRRLADEGWVQKDAGGYRLTDQGYASLRGRAVPKPAAETLNVVHALLPPHARPDDVARQLAGRWFAGLRWYGRSEAPGEITLTWLPEKGNATVRLRLSGAAVNVEVDVPQGDEAAAYAALRPLLAALADVYEAPRKPAPAPAAPTPPPAADIRGVAG